MSESTPSKPGSATAAATPPAGIAASSTPPGTRSITRTSCSAQDKMIGRSVGKARILKRLGRGGMGDVYLCQHPDYDKAIAIKILPPDLTRNDELLSASAARPMRPPGWTTRTWSRSTTSARRAASTSSSWPTWTA